MARMVPVRVPSLYELNGLGFAPQAAIGAGKAAGAIGQMVGLKGAAGQAVSVAGGAASGAQIGSAAGPWGAAIGAVLGAAFSAFGMGKKIAKSEATWDAYKKIAGQGQFVNSDDDYIIAEIWKGAFDTNHKTYRGGPIKERGDWVRWLAQLLNAAIADGRINEHSTPYGIVEQIIVPGMRAYGAGLKHVFRDLWAEMATRLIMGKGIGNRQDGKSTGDIVTLASAGFPPGFVRPAPPVAALPAPQATATPMPPVVSVPSQYGPSTGFVPPPQGQKVPDVVPVPASALPPDVVPPAVQVMPLPPDPSQQQISAAVQQLTAQLMQQSQMRNVDSSQAAQAATQAAMQWLQSQGVSAKEQDVRAAAESVTQAGAGGSFGKVGLIVAGAGLLFALARPAPARRSVKRRKRRR